jgi:serine/threonine protein kinase
LNQHLLFFRAPEVIIGHKYDGRIDIWSVGAVLAELYTGHVLFQNDSVPTMLSRISGILGPIPHDVLINGKETYKYYTSSSVVYEKNEEQFVSLIYPKHTTLESRLHFDLLKMSDDDKNFVQFIKDLLNLDPLKRCTAEEALHHNWLAGADKLEIAAPSLSFQK